MSFPTGFDLKERVRSAVDIVDVIGAQVELQPQGRNLVGRCPFHPDKRPSLTVNRERQTWKCWPCDIGGDIFSFVMKHDGVDFPTAVRVLAEQAGIAVEEYRGGKKTKPGSPDDKETLRSAIRLVSEAYFQQLESGTSDDAKIAREYLAERGISEESRKRFQIGFAPDSWSFAVDLLKKHNLSGEVALAAGVASARRSGSGHVDMFRGRLIFPIHDLQNRVISLGGRQIPAIADRHGENAGGKYVNGRETLLFRKAYQLYGLQLAREAIRKGGEALVMEGYTDVVASRQAGIEPVVAVLGTALGEHHVKILKRFADRVVLVLDGDAAGQSRADEVLELFVRAEVDMRVLTLPDESDPADFVSQHGRDAFLSLVSNAPDALDHKLARLTRGIDVSEDTHAVTDAVEKMLKIVAKTPDNLRTDQLLLRMSRTFDFKVERLEQRLAYLRDQAARRPRPKPPQQKPASKPAIKAPHFDVDPNAALAESADFDPAESEFANETSSSATATPPSARLNKLTGIDRDLFETLIECPDLAANAVEAIDPDWFDSTTATMLLSAYQDLELAGKSLDVDNLLLLVENELLKSQIVKLQERVLDRAGKLPESPEDRYAAIMVRYRERAFEIENTKQIEQLSSAALAEKDELALLQAMIDERRTRQGIKPPKETDE